MARPHQGERVKPSARGLLGCPQLGPSGERGGIEDDGGGVAVIDRWFGTRSGHDDGRSRR